MVHVCVDLFWSPLPSFWDNDQRFLPPPKYKGKHLLPHININTLACSDCQILFQRNWKKRNCIIRATCLSRVFHRHCFSCSWNLWRGSNDHPQDLRLPTADCSYFWSIFYYVKNKGCVDIGTEVLFTGLCFFSIQLSPSWPSRKLEGDTWNLNGYNYNSI